MAHNTNLSAAVGDGDDVVTVDGSIVVASGYPAATTGKVPASVLYHGADGNTVPTPTTDAHPLPVTPRTSAGTAQSHGAGAVDTGTQRSTLASDDPAVTALQLIDDAVYTDGTGTPSKAIGIAGTDGTNPQIVKTDTAGELQVDVVGALPAGTNNIGDVDIASIAAGDNNIGNVDLASAIPAGTNNIGDVDVATVPAPLSTTGGGTEATALRVTVASDSTGVLSVDDNGGSLTVDNAGTFAVQQTPATSGGDDTFKSVDIDETEEDVKTSAGQIYWIYCVNTHATAARYLKLYNATAATVVVGTTATKLDLLVPPNNSGFHIKFDRGVPFSTAICVACTTGVGDADAGAPGANEVQVHIGYK